MGHGIERDDWMVSGSGEMPWHGTNVTVVNGALTASEALKTARLDWDVQVVPSTYEWAGRSQIFSRQFTIVRASDGKALGAVGNKFKPLQNARAFDWANALVGGDGTHFETAGSLKGGRIVYLTLTTPFEVELPGGDVLKTYLLIANRHDGSAKVTVAVITIRVVCNNTLSASISGALGRFGITHTESMEARLGEAQRALGLAKGATDRAEEIATKLLAQKMNEQKFNAFLDLLLKPSSEEANEREMANIQQRRALITSVYHDHPTQQDVKGTAWGAFNAVTFYHDHLTPRRQSANQDSSPADQRMLAIVNGKNIGDEALAILSNGLGGGRWLTGKSK